MADRYTITSSLNVRHGHAGNAEKQIRYGAEAAIRYAVEKIGKYSQLTINGGEAEIEIRNATTGIITLVTRITSTYKDCNGEAIIRMAASNGHLFKKKNFLNRLLSIINKSN